MPVDQRENDMDKNLTTASAAILVLSLGACASHPDPIIDMQGVNEAAMQVDWDECAAYSEQVMIARGTAKGAAGGAVVGAAAGAISGDTANGAGYGAVFGAARSATDGGKEKERVFKNCMRGRGYRVLN
jgi:hypothetical protein